MANTIWNLLNTVPPGILFAAFVGAMFTLLVCGSIIVRGR